MKTPKKQQTHKFEGATTGKQIENKGGAFNNKM
jgi:hypothetical protein